MYKIVKKQELTTNIYLMEVEADRVAKTCEPGQFVIVRMDSESERIPLTICDYNREKGTVTDRALLLYSADDGQQNCPSFTGDR